MAAKTKEENFAVSLQRELNVIMAAIVNVIDTSLAVDCLCNNNPTINVYSPKYNI